VNLFRRDGRPLVVGHRGAAAVAPENSLAALEAAVAAGVDLVEFDVSPGLVLAHSPSEVPAEPLDLDAALAFLARHDVGVHVDVKLPGYEREVVELVRRHELAERAVLSTALGSVARRLATLAPDVTRAIGYPRDRYGVSRHPWPGSLTAGGAAALRATMPVRIPLLLRRTRASALALHRTLCSAASIAAAHRAGAPVLAWTVNDPAEALRLAGLGVDAVVSDDPRAIGDALATLGGP
jgi:glycerophosphoryl diester phosphodiesterase